jgi:uncharacterized protein
LKDAVRLLVYLLATVVLGALLAPPLFWAIRSLVTHGWLTFLGRYDFETFFHRALLVAAAILLWPFARSLSVRNMADLQIEPNPHWRRDLLFGFIFAAIPLLCCGAILLATPIFSLRAAAAINWPAVARVAAAAAVVPLIEELFFRGLVLGVLLKAGRRNLSIFVSAALYSIVHFLKAPERTSADVSWMSGFNSITRAFVQFTDPVLVAGGFTTLFLIGLILADARLQRRSLWLPIGLHAGWILTSAVFNKIALRKLVVLPWLGKNLLVGIIPLAVAGATWLIMRGWFRYHNARDTN